MNTSLNHLPKEKQELINFITGVIVEKIDPEKVILYGSYATDKWVDDEYYEDGRQIEYKSDYDFLVITKVGERRSDHEVQEIIEHRSGLNNNVSAITHDIEYVNGKLSEGQYFFSDIQKEGILLYDAGNIALAERKELERGEKRAIAKKDFDKWYESSVDFLAGAIFYANGEKFKKAAFLLHQAAEHAFNTVILVFRGYKPKTHNLFKLRRYAKHFSNELAVLFPLDTKEEKTIFDLLRKGYVEARYDDEYVITKNQIEILIERVEKLQSVVKMICKQKIDSF